MNGHYYAPFVPIPDPPMLQLAEHQTAEVLAQPDQHLVTMLALPFDDRHEPPAEYKFVDTFAPTIFDKSLAEIQAGERHISFRADGTHEGDFRGLVASTAKPITEPGGARVWAVKSGPGAGIYAQANLLTTTQAGKDAWEVITAGLGRHVSVSFDQMEYDKKDLGDGRTEYHIYNARWKEVTFVDLPALKKTWLRPSITQPQLAQISTQNFRAQVENEQPKPEPETKEAKIAERIKHLVK